MNDDDNLSYKYFVIVFFFLSIIYSMHYISNAVLFPLTVTWWFGLYWVSKYCRV